MKRNSMLCKRIMLQLEQNGHFVSETPEEAYHVALLADRGYVSAKIDTDGYGTPTKATVGRMTAIGHDALAVEFSSPPVSSNSTDFFEKYYESLVNTKHANETARDKLLTTIATGGIGLLFGIASYLKTNIKEFQLTPWITTLVLWGLVLVGLLISDHGGNIAMDKIIEKLPDYKTDVRHHFTAWDHFLHWLNGVNCIVAILGIGSFAWFLWTVA